MVLAARTERPRAYKRLARILSKSNVNEGIWAYVLLIPYLVNLLLFTAGPVIAALVLSFTHYDLLRPPIPAGVENYTRAFGDRDVQAAFRNTAYYVAAYVPITMTFALFIAIALNQKIRGIVWYRAAFFIPVVTSGVATAIMWQIVLSKLGIANYLLGLVGFRPVDWWGYERALGSIVMMGVWGGLGVLMMFWLSALQGIPVHLYEAASIDGAGWWGKFRHVTLPMLTPMALFLMILGVIGFIPGIRIDLRYHQRWAGQCHSDVSPPHIPGRFYLLLYGLCLRIGILDVRNRVHRDDDPVAPAALLGLLRVGERLDGFDGIPAGAQADSASAGQHNLHRADGGREDQTGCGHARAFDRGLLCPAFRSTTC